jgi:4-amino-4-deoxy-L-arabinose transferase-like glycosyltransferase
MARQMIKSTALLQSFHTAHAVFFQPRFYIGVALFLQLGWLSTIALTGASTYWYLLAGLAIYSILSTTLVLFLPVSLVTKIIQWKTWLLEKETRVILFLILAALALGAIYSPVQRVWSDEGKSLKAAGIIARQGWAGIIISYTNIDWLRYQHPPLMPVLYGLAYREVGENLFLLRLITVPFMAAATLTTYFLGRELYEKETGLLAALFLLSFPLTVRMGSVLMMDIQLAFFFSLALLLLIYSLRKPLKFLAVLTGFVIGLGLLTKYIMVFIFGVLASFLVAHAAFRKLWLQVGVAALLSLAILAGWLVYAQQHQILGDQFERILNFSGIYYLVKDAAAVISESESLPQPAPEQNPEADLQADIRNRILRLGLETLFTRLPSALGVHHIPLILLGGLSLVQRRAPADRLILMWIGVVVVGLFLTLPDHRYFIMTFPAIAILMANYLRRFPELTPRVVVLSVLFLAGALVLFANWNREAMLFLPY